MIGHDIVPHTDLSNGENISFTTASATVSQHITHEHSELGHIFEHFQHSSNESTLKYIAGAVKTLDVKRKFFKILL